MSVEQTLLELVSLDSPSGQERAVAKYVMKRLIGLGLKPRQDKIGNVIARIPGGAWKKRLQGRALLLNAHMDRVPPGLGHKPVIKAGVVQSNGKTNLGADNAAGITVILEALEWIKKEKIKVAPLVLVFTVQEETGLRGAMAFKQKDLSAKYGLVIDNAFKVGEMVDAGMSYVGIDVEITGRSGHSAGDLAKTADVVPVVTEGLKKAFLGHELDKKETRMNVGIINVGTARNAIPDKAKIAIELRSFMGKRVINQQVMRVKRSFEKEAKKRGCQVKFSLFELGGYKVNLSEPTVRLWREVMRQGGKRFKTGRTFIGSDAQAFRLAGIKASVISTGVWDEHSVKEKVRLSDLEWLTGRLVEFLRKWR